MIKADFLLKEKELIGFTVSGHANSAKFGEDIICAGVSSALMLTINTITDFINAEADVDASNDKEGYASLTLKEPFNKSAIAMINSFEAHLSILEQQYGHIKVRRITK